MFAAVLSAFLFAASATFSQRAARIFGSLEANFFRLCGACTILGLVTWHFLPRSITKTIIDKATNDIKAAEALAAENQKALENLDATADEVK